jgi:acyl carrier protein
VIFLSTDAFLNFLFQRKNFIVVHFSGINDVTRVSHHATLPELGMDSITSQEVLQQLKERFKIVVTPREIRTMTFSK